MAPPDRRWLYLILVGYLVLAVATGISLAGVRRSQSQDCRSRQEARVAVREVAVTLRTLVVSSGQNRLDLSKVPGFDQLDPATRAFFSTLSAPAPSDWQTEALTTIDASLDKLPPLECQ